MASIQRQIERLHSSQKEASLEVYTLGSFRVLRVGEEISSKTWGRDKTLQLFQFFVTARHRRALHKEQIVSRIWEDANTQSGDRDFKVALHGIHKVLEPDRKSRGEALYIQREGQSYQLNQQAVWIDAEAFESWLKLGNQAYMEDPAQAIECYEEAIHLYQGRYLPNRIYEDWTSAERERLQLLALNTLGSLGELIVSKNPQESIRLAQEALRIDNTNEEAYRLQMKAYLERGNRPMAIKTFLQCEEVLKEEFGIAPLPETQSLLAQIEDIA